MKLSRRWLRPLLLALLVYIGSLGILMLSETSLMYHPYPGPLTPQEAGLEGFSRHHFTNEAHQRIPYWEHPAEGPLLFYFHGNGAGLHAFTSALDYLADAGFHVVAMEYRGYPGADGTPSQAGIVADALELQARITQAATDKPVVYWGYSLGSGVASQVARIAKPDVMVLEAPFTAAVDLARRMFPLYPLQWVMRDQYRSHEALKDLAIPTVILHGTHDPIVPLASGEALYAGLAEPKRFHRYERADHFDLQAAGAYDDAVAFISEQLAQR